MAKLTLTDTNSGYDVPTTINANNDLIETAVENTLSRDGTSPNAMAAELDMNSNKITNLTPGVAGTDAVNVNQLTGQAAVANTELDELTDVTITAAAKGDILVFNGTVWVDLTVGSNNEVLTADSGEANGIKWAAAASSSSQDHGEMYFNLNAGQTSVPNTSLYYKIADDPGTTDYTAGALSGFTHSAGGLTSTNGGTFLVNASVTVRGAGGAIYDVAVHVDGTLQSNLEQRCYDTNGTNPRDAFTISGILTLSAAEEVDLRIRNETSTTGPYIEYLNVSLVEIL